MVLVRCIIDFDDIQLWLRQFCLNINICKVKTAFLIFLGQNLKKIVITLQILRFKQTCLSQSWISLKSIMQLTNTFFPNSAIFIEKKWVENRLWGKSAFLWGKKMYHDRWAQILISKVHWPQYNHFYDGTCSGEVRGHGWIRTVLAPDLPPWAPSCSTTL